MGNDSTTAFRTREQLRKFLGIFSPRFSKPKLEFLEQMLFGIQAARDTLVSEIARSLQEDILAKNCGAIWACVFALISALFAELSAFDA